MTSEVRKPALCLKSSLSFARGLRTALSSRQRRGHLARGGRGDRRGRGGAVGGLAVAVVAAAVFLVVAVVSGEFVLDALED